MPEDRYAEVHTDTWRCDSSGVSIGQGGHGGGVTVPIGEPCPRCGNRQPKRTDGNPFPVGTEEWAEWTLAEARERRARFYPPVTGPSGPDSRVFPVPDTRSGGRGDAGEQATDVDENDRSLLLAGLRNGVWLDGQTFPPLRYAVPGVIPEGFTLLVGPPKIGKSWLTLGLGLAVASGGKALGIPVGNARPVFLLALEDGHRRLQDRCRVLHNPTPLPGALDYLTRIAVPGRVLDTIGAWLGIYGDSAPLVILDTLGRAMPQALPGESAYQRDYRVGAALKRLVDEHPGAALVVVHHDRKAGSDDFVDAVSGTHGLAGAADSIVVVHRDRNQPEGLLKVTGRDIPEGEYAVKLVDGAHWKLDGQGLAEAAQNAAKARVKAKVGDRMGEVIDVVTRAGTGIGPTKVAEALGIEPNAASTYLGRAVDAGRLQKTTRGRYTPVVSVVSVGTNGSEAGGYNSPNTYNTPTGESSGMDFGQSDASDAPTEESGSVPGTFPGNGERSNTPSDRCPGGHDTATAAR